MNSYYLPSIGPIAGTNATVTGILYFYRSPLQEKEHLKRVQPRPLLQKRLDDYLLTSMNGQHHEACERSCKVEIDQHQRGGELPSYLLIRLGASSRSEMARLKSLFQSPALSSSFETEALAN